MSEERVEYTATETTLTEQVANLRVKVNELWTSRVAAQAFVENTVTNMETLAQSFVEQSNDHVRQMSEWAQRLDDIDHSIAAIEQRLADGDLTGPLSGSLVLVELRRIADALEDLRSDVTFSPPEPPVLVRIEALERQRKFDHEELIRLADRQTRLEVSQSEPQPCDCAAPDCAELWRLAREYVNAGRNPDFVALAGDALRAFVREYSTP